MLIPHASSDAPWEYISRMVFWNRNVTLEKWQEGCLNGSKAFLPESVHRMSSQNFTRFLGRENFVAHWPQIRLMLPADHPGVARLDARWSWLKTGTFNMPPEAALAPFPGRSREVYDTIVHNQGASIYDVAKKSGVPYRRVHAHVTKMTEDGLVRTRTDATGPRVTRRLYTMR
jgi:hypothetical protein